MIPQPHPITPDCVSAWRLDQPVLHTPDPDVSGSGQTLLPAGTGPWPGTSGGLPFGNGTKFQIPFYNSDYRLTSACPELYLQQFTYAFWMFVGNQPTGQYGTILDMHYSSAGGAKSFYVGISPDEYFYVRFYVTFAEFVDVVVPTPLTVGNLYHIGITHDGTTLRIWINDTVAVSATTTNLGNPLSTVTIRYSTGTYSYSFAVGRNPESIGFNLYSELEDLAVYNTAKDLAWFLQVLGSQPPIVSNQNPAPTQDQVALDTTIGFRLTDTDGDLNPSSVSILVDDVLAYSNQLSQNEFNVVRTPVSLGYDYVVTLPEPLLYGAEVEVGILAADYAENQISVYYPFFTVEDPRCFVGPLNAFEERVKEPFTTEGSRYLEYLRVWLLRYALNVIHTDRAVRWVYLKAYEHPASTILNLLVPTPSTRERAAILCGRRTNIQVNNDLKEHPLLLERALTELALFGVPDKHRKTLQSYIDTGNPNDRVPVACLMVFLTRSLEDNELI